MSVERENMIDLTIFFNYDRLHYLCILYILAILIYYVQIIYPFPHGPRSNQGEGRRLRRDCLLGHMTPLLWRRLSSPVVLCS